MKYPPMEIPGCLSMFTLLPEATHGVQTDADLRIGTIEIRPRFHEAADFVGGVSQAAPWSAAV